MDAEQARAYLMSMRVLLRRAEDRSAAAREYGLALDAALDAVAPPEGAGRCAWVYLPDAARMPYGDIEAAATLYDRLSFGDAPLRALVRDGREVLCTALLVYRSVLCSLFAAPHSDWPRASLSPLPDGRAKQDRRREIS